MLTVYCRKILATLFVAFLLLRLAYGEPVPDEISCQWFFSTEVSLNADATLSNLRKAEFSNRSGSVPERGTWVRCSFSNATVAEKEIYLLCPQPTTIKYFDAPKSENASFFNMRYGIYRPDKTNLYWIKLKAGGTIETYIYLPTGKEPLPVTISAAQLRKMQNEHSQELRMEVILQAIFFGVIFFQFLYTLVQGFFIRKAEYLYYLLYMVVISSYFLSKYEYLFTSDFIFAQHTTWWIYLDKTAPFLSYFFYYRLARAFVNVPAVMPKLNKTVRIFEWILLSYAVFDFGFIVITGNTALEDSGFFVFGIFAYLSTYYIITTFLKSRIALTYFILTGAIFLTTGTLVSFLAFVMQQAGVVKWGFDTLVFNQVGTILELFAFTTGLAYKARLDEREKIIAQENLKKEIEVKEKEKQNAITESKRQERERIARDLHDDIGSTLGSISVYTEVAKKRIEKNQGVEEVFDKLGETTREMMERMSDIVWSMNEQSDSFAKLTARMKSFAAILLPSKNIELQWSETGDLEDMNPDVNCRKNIFLIYKEALYNTVKYAGCSKVEVQIGKTGNVFNMKITDNGDGFNVEQDKAYNGNGIKNMQARATDMGWALIINSEIGAGTMVELTAVVKEEDILK